MTLAIRTEQLSREFGSLKALSNVSLSVPAGSVFGFLGPNGAGKTTTIRLLLGLIRPDSGAVYLNGSNLREDRRGALRGVGAIVETPALYPNLTGRENLKLALRTHGGKRSEIATLAKLVDLAHALDRRVGRYSLGMKQRLAVARALLNHPRLLILDEPTNGLDPAGIAQFRDLISSLPERFGTTVFLSSHLLGEIEHTATHCALLHRGNLLFHGHLDELATRAPGALWIEALDLPTLHEALNERGLAPTLADDGALVTGFEDAHARASLLSALLAEGHVISGFERRKPRLEEIFLALTGSPR